MKDLTAPVVAALNARAITKTFPGVRALTKVDFEIRPGEIHALLGENGAGKSTLIKTLTGIYRADGGHFELGGRQVSIDGPRAARDLGINVVPQDVVMVPQLSIGRNILLGEEGFGTSKSGLSPGEHAAVAAALDRVGAQFDPDRLTSELSVPELRLAQIARALMLPGNILILDEPTAVLSEPDADALMSRLEGLRASGTAIVYVTHRLGEVMRLADRITILRDGQNVGTFLRGEIDREGMVATMARIEGKAPVTARPPAPVPRNETRLNIVDIAAGARVHGATLRASPGEIIGIAGVQGSGHGDLLRAILGQEPLRRGTIQIDGADFRSPTPRRALRQGIVLVPADRRGAGIAPNLSIRANLVLLGRLRAEARRFGLRWHLKELSLAGDYVQGLDIRPGSTEALLGTMSGGNQQKVVIARAFEARARVLLVEEPTQGVDVGAKAEIHALLKRAASEQGCVVLVASSEFEELLSLTHRIHVMREGRTVAELETPQATYKEILDHALA